MTQHKPVKVAIIGATGYVGIEIVRLLQNHPLVEITAVIGQSFVGQPISQVYPNLRGICDMECSALDLSTLPDLADIYINCLPHGISKDFIPELLARGKKIIDHGGDYRYKDVAVYEAWYHTKHMLPELLDIAVYGLPELYRADIQKAQLVANPGCYPTCSILALAPLLKAGLVHPKSIYITAASGVTGAGRRTDLPYQFSECAENYKAYGVATHRHTSEIEQELSLLAGEEVPVTFTPHLAPMKRGMLATIYADLLPDALEKLHQFTKTGPVVDASDGLAAANAICESAAACESGASRAAATFASAAAGAAPAATVTTPALLEHYAEFYRHDPFVRILPPGVLPETKHVAGSNFIDIGFVVDQRLGRVVILSALDNLGKGASSQAIQDLNLMAGFPETTGLLLPGYYL